MTHREAPGLRILSLLHLLVALDGRKGCMLGSPASLTARFQSLFLSDKGFVFAPSLLCLLQRSAYLQKMSAPKHFFPRH